MSEPNSVKVIICPHCHRKIKVEASVSHAEDCGYVLSGIKVMDEKVPKPSSGHTIINL